MAIQEHSLCPYSQVGKDMHCCASPFWQYFVAYFGEFGWLVGHAAAATWCPSRLSGLTEENITTFGNFTFPHREMLMWAFSVEPIRFKASLKGMRPVWQKITGNSRAFTLSLWSNLEGYTPLRIPFRNI